MAATPSPSVEVALEPKRSLHQPPAVTAPKPTVVDPETAPPAPKRTRKAKATEKPEASSANAAGAEVPASESCHAILKKFLLSYYEEKGGANFQTASLPPAYYDKLFEGVAKIIEGGETRAVANGRKIPQPHDLGQ